MPVPLVKLSLVDAEQKKTSWHPDAAVVVQLTKI
jgi:hypothetical protein